MRKLLTIPLLFLALTFISGCGAKKIALNPGLSPDLAILTLGADTSMLNQDQINLLNRNLQKMDNNLQWSLRRVGLQPYTIFAENNFNTTSKGHLLKYSITEHKIIPPAARFGFGMMAGADRLGVHFELIDSNNNTILSWDDTQGSSQGIAKIIRVINNNTIAKLRVFYGS